MLCAKLEIGSLVPEKKIFFFNFVNVFLLFRYFLPLEKGGALHLYKLEYPSPKDALCQVWMKAAQLFSRRRFLNLFNVFSLFHNFVIFAKFGKNLFFFFFNFVNVFLLFGNYLPLIKGGKNTSNSLYLRTLCAKFG